MARPLHLKIFELRAYFEGESSGWAFSHQNIN